MRIVKIEEIEDCFDGSAEFAYHTDLAWSCEEIMKLKELGELKYFSDFPRPFFRLLTPEGVQIKGVEGDTRFRIIYPSRNRNELIKNILERFDSLSSKDIAKK